MTRAAVTLFLCGDVMLARGVDQILPHPGDPALAEPSLTNALDYVRLAEEAHGPIPRPAPFEYVWGDALAELERRAPDARIVNLETAVTAGGERQDKPLHYRMSPGNVPCLSAARLDCCALANNHVLDFGAAGLADTLAALAAAGIRTAGAGLDAERARAPAVLPLSGKGRVLVFALADGSGGVPEDWAAGAGRPGLWRLADLGRRERRELTREVARWRRPGDVVVVSVHWGANWGYAVPPARAAFARTLIDEGGADVIHGHSSHHPTAVEIHAGRPILYGCGDFINDYEGISGYEEYRAELGFMYFVSLEAGSGALRELSLVPTRLERFRVRRAAPAEARWLRERLERASAPFGTRVERARDGSLSIALTR